MGQSCHATRDCEPRSIVVHPSPTQFSAVAWRSPVDGAVEIEAEVSDAHPECGNGVEFFLQHVRGSRVVNVWQGEFTKGGKASLPATTLTLHRGELISLLVGPRQGDHTCDLTQIKFKVSEAGRQERVWDLAGDVSGDLHAGNPHPDRFGHADTWHFYRGDLSTLDRSDPLPARVPPRSLLADWQSTVDGQRRSTLASQIQMLASGKPPVEADTPDAGLYRQLHSLPIPIDHQRLRSDLNADPRLRNATDGQETDRDTLIVETPATIEFKLASELAAGGEVSVTTSVESPADAETSRQQLGGIQVVLDFEKPDGLSTIDPNRPLLVAEGWRQQQAAQQLDAFRQMFPAALCYARIVPVDEVVTLLLFYREDDHLQRLMLDSEQITELDRLWDELFFVSQEPLQLVVSLEQLSEFATQDRPDLVTAFAPLRKPIRSRADKFAERLVQCEPVHVQGVLEFAGRAWRRPLTAQERTDLKAFYGMLREQPLGHEPAIRSMLARVLTSPNFLFRRELSQPGKQPTRISSTELASRLSFFLWSSVPDAELRAVAESGGLTDESELWLQTQRMLQHQRTRRLAEQFACQWLHLRDFDRMVEKNEKLYPQFARLRGDMYEETVRFFAAMFRENGSVLDILDAYHTFLNESLAKHYGIDEVEGADWRRVERVDRFGRGGVLGMATVLSSQSGVSRTSPILRGNWI